MSDPAACGFCGSALAPGAKACPKCAYPASGRFDAAPPAKRKERRTRPTEACRNCGDPFPAGRPACPHCGADASTGWKSGDEIDEAAATIPEFDDEDYRRVVREANPGDTSLWSSRQFRIAVIGVLLVAAMVVPLLLALRHL